MILNTTQAEKFTKTNKKDMIIYNFLIPDTKRFLKNIESLLPENITKITLNSFVFGRSGSIFGRYVLELELTIFVNDRQETLYLPHYTNDSTLFDEYQDIEHNSQNYNNFVKKWVLYLLESDENKEKIIQAIEELKEN